MDLKEIQALIKFVANQEVDEVKIEKENFKINIKKHSEDITTVMQTPTPISAPAIAASPAEITESTPSAPEKKLPESNLIEVKAPMIGTFYRSSNPETPEFVNVGDVIKEGTVLCIVEAMKLFNEIESEVSGKIVEILVDNATPVEYNQPLFLVDPS